METIAGPVANIYALMVKKSIYIYIYMYVYMCVYIFCLMESICDASRHRCSAIAQC